MPYRSKKQRAFLHANKPGLAKKWDKRYGGKIKRKKKRKSKKRKKKRSTRRKRR